MQGQSTDGLLGLHCRHAREGSVKRALCSCTKHAHDKTHHSGGKKKKNAPNAEKYTKNTKGTTVTAARVAGKKQNPQSDHRHRHCTSHTNKHRVTNTTKTGKMRPRGGKKNARNHAPKGVVQDSPRSELARTERKRRNRQHRERRRQKTKSRKRRPEGGTTTVTTPPTHTKLNSALAGASWPFAL